MPDPRGVDLRRLRLARVRPAVTLYTTYTRRHWPSLFNASGSGNARFSPLTADGLIVPTLYAAASMTVALLETAFHDVHAMGARLVSASLQLAPRGVIALSPPSSLSLVDLRDDELARIEVSRAQLVSTTPVHYPCTREWAAVLHARRIGGVRPAGILWSSRVAELAAGDSLLLADLLGLVSDVCVLFGDRVPADPSAWHPGQPHYDDLSDGDGRLLAEQIAEQLRAVIVPA